MYSKNYEKRETQVDVKIGYYHFQKEANLATVMGQPDISSKTGLWKEDSGAWQKNKKGEKRNLSAHALQKKGKEIRRESKRRQLGTGKKGGEKNVTVRPEDHVRVRSGKETDLEMTFRFRTPARMVSQGNDEREACMTKKGGPLKKKKNTGGPKDQYARQGNSGMTRGETARRGRRKKKRPLGKMGPVSWGEKGKKQPMVTMGRE